MSNFGGVRNMNEADEVIAVIAEQQFGVFSRARQRAMAAVLWTGERAAISHSTAARLLRLDGIRSDDLHITRA
jgi:hypothetical protein